MSNDGFLTTHVLDTARGCPANGIEIELFRIDGTARTHLKTVKTNDDGRTDAPLIEKGEISCGAYELIFRVNAYFEGYSEQSENPFLDIVPIRFGIDDATSHYHVPLLISPFSYSTYRGS